MVVVAKRPIFCPEYIRNLGLRGGTGGSKMVKRHVYILCDGKIRFTRIEHSVHKRAAQGRPCYPKAGL